MTPSGGSSVQKVLPSEEYAERALLSSILVDNRILEDVLVVLSETDFYYASNRIVFSAMVEISARREAIDAISLVSQLNSKNVLDKVGGVDLIVRLQALVPSSVHSKTYAQMVRRASVLRTLNDMCLEMHDRIMEGIPSYDDFINEVEARLFAILEKNQTTGYRHMREVLQETMKLLEERYESNTDLTGIPSGFLDLDDLTAGWQRSDLVIVAARPAMGKTSLVLNMMAHAALHAKEPIAAAFFSLEMSAMQLAIRMLSSEAKVNQSRLQRGNLTEGEWKRVINAVGDLSRSEIWIDETPAISIREFQSRARRLQKDHGIGIIFVDYLQLMKGSRTTGMSSREQEISEISRGLKETAKELQIPVIALSQLNRGVESRADKRPLMSDLRESGAIEQDADLILFIYRDSVYHETDEDADVAELIVGKHRNGALATVKLLFSGEHTRFDNFTPHDPGY